jgi:hypothetical protein
MVYDERLNVVLQELDEMGGLDLRLPEDVEFVQELIMQKILAFEGGEIRPARRVGFEVLDLLRSRSSQCKREGEEAPNSKDMKMWQQLIRPLLEKYNISSRAREIGGRFLFLYFSNLFRLAYKIKIGCMYKERSLKVRELEALGYQLYI